MATQLDSNVKDDLKTQFVTREGTYRLLTLPEYSRPNRVGYTNNQSSPQVRVSIVTLPTSSTINASNGNSHNNNSQRLIGNGTANGAGDGYDINATNTLNGPQSAFVVPSSMDARLGAGMSMHTIINSSGNGTETNGLSTNQVYGGDRICFNFGRELYVYAFRGMKKGAELSKPIDKKFYKGTNPSCHDFNATTATATGAPLLVGFTTGQIQLVSPQVGPRELRKLYNEERLIDKTKVTCLKWLPNSPNLFLAAHASGHLYLYNEDLPCTTAAPNYQPFKVGDGYSILTCKSKSSRNPLYKWVFTTENCCINEFSFSPCGSHLAVVSQDGFLRVFHYDSMELLGIARSYFGGFLCVCWSPDGKYIVVGGEDDLVTVWSFHERRVVARGQGHRSWVSVVAFDPYTTSYTSWDGGDFSDDENQMNDFGRFAAGDSAGPVAGNSFDVCGPFIGNDKNSAPLETRRRHSTSFRSDGSSLTNDKFGISYRLGSVSQDTQICLWDITEDVLRHPLPLRQRVNSSNFNDTSFMNGSIDKDGIKLIRPVAMSSTTNSFPAPQHGSSPTSTITANAINNTKDVAPAAEHNSNSSSSKFSTANCTASSQSSNANTPPDEANNVQASTPNSGKTHKSLTGNTIKFPNCISATKSDSIDGSLVNNHVKNHYSSSTSSTSGYYSKTSNNGSSKNSDNSNSGSSAFNTLTQKFSNFNFLNSSDKKSNSLHLGKSNDVATQTRHNRKGLNLLKSYNQQQQQSGSNSSNNRQSFTSSTQMENNASTHTFGSLKLGKSSGQYSALKMASTTTTSPLSAAALTTPPGVVVTTYDPLKLIGTPACPRFDECPILEPLVCKKIAHERLSALIFREDCFLTACQDGFIYTWARPGYATNITQHLSPSQMAPPAGTIT